ncbi:MAG: 3'-5' exonuclease [Faecalibacterium sp.]|jgi:DNA helicase-2/ATP-dependent DNA helicase PcrA|nr:3'-5' exonuclease [Faecalibacterium sp.]
MAASLQQEFCALRDTYIEKQFGRLNDMQRQAVFTTDGPLLILAGAGSGKTTVLVNRIANLIRFGSAHGSSWTPREVTEDDVKALKTAIMTGTDAPAWLDGMLRQNAVRSWNVMAITFTNKAAGELKERLRNMLGGEEGDEVFASTFHSACVRILRRWAESIGYPRSFTIYDTDDSQRVMKAVYKELSIDDKFFPIKSAINQMSRWKDQLVSPEEALRTPARDTKGAIAAKVYAAYEKKLREAGAFDFDDLIYQTVQLLAEHEDVREFYQNKYRYLLVDEYQDTSVAQFRLVSLLTGPEKNICVVGDDDQSIYRFRGATIENILNFERIFPGTKTIRLEQNYRSTSNILNAANCVIQHNTERKGKTLWTRNDEGDKVQVYTAENEQDEAMHIADVIGEHLKEGGHLADHAVLYRMNAQSAPIESYFTRAGIPHKIVGGQRFNDRKEVKDIHSYMSIVANARDDVRLRRIINEPARKIGNTTVDVIADLAAQQGISMLEVISHADAYAKLSRAIMPLLKFWQIYEKLQESLETRTLDEFAQDVIEVTGYKAMLEADAAKGHEDAADRLQNLGQLVNNVKNYCDQHGEEASLEGYLEDIALISDIDSYNESADQVVLMTIHSAKGLEFPYVFLIGMEEGVFPSEMSKYSEADLEEERRLAYVGITRAKKELYISNSVSRMLYGRTQRNEPSRFLREIEPEYIEETRSPALERRSSMGWGSSYSDTVPGGASGYSGASGWGRNSSSFGGRTGGYNSGGRSGYLNSEYNSGAHGGFGDRYSKKQNTEYKRTVSTIAEMEALADDPDGYMSGKISGKDYEGYVRDRMAGRTTSGFGENYSQKSGTPLNDMKRVFFAGTPAPKSASTGPKHYEVGDIVEHKVFGRGRVLAVKAAAGDQIVEINFEKVGVKKTMANFAPLTKITEE